MTHIIFSDPKQTTPRYRLHLCPEVQGLIEYMACELGISAGKYISELIENDIEDRVALANSKAEIKQLKRQKTQLETQLKKVKANPKFNFQISLG